MAFAALLARLRRCSGVRVAEYCLPPMLPASLVSMLIA